MRRALPFFASLLLVAGACSSQSDTTNGAPTPDGGTDLDAGGGADTALPKIDPCAKVDAAMRASCQELPGVIDASVTLTKGCYHVASTPRLGNNVTLTVPPGTTLIFADGEGIDAGETSAFVAKGTREEPICMTGDKAEAGSWAGLTLGRTEGDAHALDWVTIEYGGNTTSDKGAAAIKTSSDSRVVTMSLTNTTVRKSQGWGLFLIGSADVKAFSGNEFTGNVLGPASVDSQVAGFLDATSSYKGNGTDEVEVRSYALDKNATWHAIGVPFHLNAGMHVSVPWTVEAPNTIVMPEGVGISIDGDGAALTAVGTATAPIVFTGAEKTRGFWNALTFSYSNNPKNRLEHVDVSYGGSTKSDAKGACVLALSDSHGVTASFANNTFHDCEGWGLGLGYYATTPTFANNTFTKNGDGPVWVSSQGAHQLDTGSTYTGNDVDRIRVPDDRVGKTVTWLDLGVPYELESYIHIDQVWTLAPGVTLYMAQGATIDASGDAAAFHAVGTAQKPITISSLVKTNGYWSRILFDGSLNTNNQIAYATVEYGGGTAYGYGMIHAQSDSHGVKIGVNNTTIRHSGQYGLWLGHYAQSSVASNTFADNALGDTYQQP